MRRLGWTGVVLLVLACQDANGPASFEIVSGDAQQAVVGRDLSAPLVVRAKPPGLPVVFTVASGGGAIRRGNQRATSDTVISDSGLDTSGIWVLGTHTGTNTVTVTMPSAPGVLVTFTATGIHDLPNTLTKFAGDSQTVPAGTAVPILPAVLVTDGFGNPIPGIAVEFQLPGTLSTPASITGAITTTDSTGVATIGSWTLGTAKKEYSLLAYATIPAGHPSVSFSAFGN